MSESQAVGIRVDDKLMAKVDVVCQHERVDRSTAMRKLLEEGYQSYITRMAAERYKSGKTTMSGAADEAGISMWDMQSFLVKSGFKSEYSVEDLQKEAAFLEKKKKTSLNQALQTFKQAKRE